MKRISYILSASLCLLSTAVHTTSPKRTQKKDPSLMITVIGTGYVGLVTGTCLAEFGNEVKCVDIDSGKIDNLKKGIIPIYEPGLDVLVARNVQQGRLTFSDDVVSAIQQAHVIFIAVGTPMSETGAADLSALRAVIRSIAQNVNFFKVIVTKSTVPIGTGEWINQTMLDYGVPADQFAIVSNPEFLREGSAINDFLYPDRIVIGTASAKAETLMRRVYEHLVDQEVAYVSTNVKTAESIKYAANAFLAIKISFINEVANLCDITGADVQPLAYGIGLDQRINRHFLNPGPGFGGSCFPKDTEELLHTSRKYGMEIHTVQAALQANEIQKEIPVKKLFALMNNSVAGKTIAILGLAFKANTDDVRYSPAIPAINVLLKEGAHVRAYDPQAMGQMKEECPTITYCDSLENAIYGADAIIVMTEWDEFKTMDLARVGSLLNQRILVDARNILDIESLHAHGFIFDNIGRSCLATPRA